MLRVKTGAFLCSIVSEHTETTVITVRSVMQVSLPSGKVLACDNTIPKDAGGRIPPSTPSPASLTHMSNRCNSSSHTFSFADRSIFNTTIFYTAGQKHLCAANICEIIS